MSNRATLKLDHERRMQAVTGKDPAREAAEKWFGPPGSSNERADIDALEECIRAAFAEALDAKRLVDWCLVNDFPTREGIYWRHRLAPGRFSSPGAAIDSAWDAERGAST